MMRLGRPPQNDDELYQLVKTMWNITIPRHKVCEEHNAPFEAFAHSYFNRSPQILIHGSRGLSGKSRLMSILGITKAAVQGSDVNILGGSLSQSANIHETMRDAWYSKNAPTFLLTNQNTQTLIRLTNNAKIRPLTASQKTVRGPHPANLLLDEIDEMDIDILNAALGQPMPQKNYRGDIIPAHTSMASTWQYPDKTFAEVYQRFQENGLPLFTWCFKDAANPIDGWLDEKTIEQKKLEVPAEMWRVEYELGEPSIGNRAFDTEAVEKMFAEEPPKPRKKDKDYEEYVIENYQTAEDYVIAADWAKEQDFTVISVWKCSKLPMQLVYYMKMRRRPYPVMINAYNKLLESYHAAAIHDATGLGNVVQDYIDGRAQNFKMVGERRANMLTEYVNCVERGRVKAPHISSAFLAHKFCTVGDLYSNAQEFHLPDDVCSFALAWHLVARRPVATDPIIVPADHGATFIEEGITKNPKRTNALWEVGQVRRTSEEPESEYQFMV
jgi:hypothetical protein